MEAESKALVINFDEILAVGFGTSKRCFSSVQVRFSRFLSMAFSSSVCHFLFHFPCSSFLQSLFFLLSLLYSRASFFFLSFFFVLYFFLFSCLSISFTYILYHFFVFLSFVHFPPYLISFILLPSSLPYLSLTSLSFFPSVLLSHLSCSFFFASLPALPPLPTSLFSSYLTSLLLFPFLLFYQNLQVIHSLISCALMP